MADYTSTVPNQSNGYSTYSRGAVSPEYTPYTSTNKIARVYKANETLYPPEYDGTTLSEEAAAELEKLGIEIDSSVRIMKNGQHYKPVIINGTEIYPNRVPDAYDYHIAREGSPKIPLQPVRGTAEWVSNTDLATARYMSNVGPFGGRATQQAFDHYAYNMWKEYNPNTAATPVHGHIFITRPDLYLCNGGLSIRQEILNRNDELATIARTNPQIFVDLMDKSRSGDETNINMYLSNQAYGISLSPASLGTVETSGDKRGYRVQYGSKMRGTGNDVVTINFREDNMLTTTNTARAWMKYIDLVYSGLLSPKLVSESGTGMPDDSCHALFRRIDYMSSIYFIVTDAIGSNILFWRKYFGVFPISDNVNILSMTDNRITRPDKTDIQFQYQRFYDCRIKDLYAFNLLTNERLLNSVQVGLYDPSKPGSNGPLGGPPYIVMDTANTGNSISHNIFARRPSWYPRLVNAASGTQIAEGTGAIGSKEFIKKYWS
jgi:hypothetical protein